MELFAGQSAQFDKDALKDAFENQCLNDRGAFYKDSGKNANAKNLPYFNEVSQMRMGQLTLYRVRLECLCVLLKKGDRCAKFLPVAKQKWPSYMGKLGDGVFWRVSMKLD